MAGLRRVASAGSKADARATAHQKNEGSLQFWEPAAPLEQPCGHSPWEAPGCWPTAWPSWSESHSCMRMKGSRPFCVSLLHGFGRDSMSLTLPWERPSTWAWWDRKGRLAGFGDRGHHLPSPLKTLRHCCSLRGQGCLHLVFTSYSVPAPCCAAPSPAVPLPMSPRVKIRPSR